MARMVKFMLQTESELSDDSLARAVFLAELAQANHPGHWEVMLSEARIRQLQGDTEVARELVRRVLLLEPENREALELHSQLNSNGGD